MFGITVSLPVFVPPPVALIVKLSSFNYSERESGFDRYLHCFFVFLYQHLTQEILHHSYSGIQTSTLTVCVRFPGDSRTYGT